jgi:hypothetical protein
MRRHAVVLIAATLLAGCSSSGGVGVLGTTPPGTSAATTTSAASTATSQPSAATSAPTATASTTPAPAPSTTTAAPVTGPVVLRAPKTSAVKEYDAATGCSSFADDGGWTATCTLAHTAGGDTYAVVERRPLSGGQTAWRAEVLTFVEAAGGWVVRLRAADDTGESYTGVKATAVDLTGDGKPELIVGFRNQGSADFLNLDLVHRSGTSPSVVAHRELSHGSAHTETGALVDYSAAYPHSEPECCPAYWFRSVLRFGAGAYHETASSHVKEPPPSPLG